MAVPPATIGPGVEIKFPISASPDFVSGHKRRSINSEQPTEDIRMIDSRMRGQPQHTTRSHVKWRSKTFSPCPVILTVFRNDPFGEHVNRLTPFEDKNYAVRQATQTGNFKELAFCTNVGINPFRLTRLRKFNRIVCELGMFPARTIACIDLH